jgi:hypothetical protein
MKKLAVEIACKTVENQGCSLNINGCEPVKGFMVGLSGREQIINVLTFTHDDVQAFIEKNMDVLKDENIFVGTWISGDSVYMDCSINLPEKNFALKFGALNGQICIWDVLNKKEIYRLIDCQ